MWKPELGLRVRIVDADICGVIVAHTRYLDGSERFDVTYWHEGKRETIPCMQAEIEPGSERR